MRKSIGFSKVDMPYGWMGNMSPFKIKYEDMVWLTSEALFQALRFEDEEIRELIRAEKSPMSAKMKAKKFKTSMLVDPMSDKDIENMRLCLRLKINQHPQIKTWLLETGDAFIYEDIGKRNKERDLFWGLKFENGKMLGKNMMGKLWMEFRNELNSKLDKNDSE